MNDSFAKLGVAEPFCLRLSELGMKGPTAIQQLAIPHLLKGRHLIAHSQTGTGKTLAYLLPILTKLNTSEANVQAVIIAPTNELAMQITYVLATFTENRDVVFEACIGSANINRQIERLKKNKPHLVVGTVGRLLELAEKKKLKLHEVNMLVVDEADRIKKTAESWKDYLQIAKKLKADCQHAFFSATIREAFSNELTHLDEKPLFVTTGGNVVETTNVQHLFLTVEERKKFDVLRGLLSNLPHEKVLVFVNEANKGEELVEKLTYKGINVALLSAQRTKTERANDLKKFRSGAISVLVTTDVAARGLDIARISHVILYQLSNDKTSYVHRSGRTGRGGQKGTVLTFVTERELPLLQKLRKQLQLPLMEVMYKHGQVREKNDDKGKHGKQIRRINDRRRQMRK